MKATASIRDYQRQHFPSSAGIPSVHVASARVSGTSKMVRGLALSFLLILTLALVPRAAGATAVTAPPAQPAGAPAQSNPAATDFTISPRLQYNHLSAGTTQVYHFTVQNTTAAAVQVTVQAQSQQGWVQSVSPPATTLGPNAQTSVAVTVYIPAGANNLSDFLHLTVTDGGTPAAAGLALWTGNYRFSDVPASTWPADPVQALSNSGAISGYGDGTFRPGATVTRAQIAKMIVMGMGWDIYTPAHPSFTDVPATSWTYGYVETAVHYGVLDGYGDGSFRPNTPITRAQLAKLVVASGGWDLYRPAQPSFSDVPASNWVYPYAETAVVLGFLSGYADGTFRPNASATRAQVAKIVTNDLLLNPQIHHNPHPTATATPRPPTATPRPTSVPTQTPVPPSGQIYWGSYIKGATYNANWGDAPWDLNTWNTFDSHAGKNVNIVHWGEAWQSGGGSMQPFETSLYETVREHGAIPMINWNPWQSCCGTDQPNWTLAKVINGTYDAYITQWATDAKNWGHPFFVRMGDEMNGTWYPWSEAVNGNQPGQYVQMWRHVHDIFTQVGANNVTWVWCPNSEYDGSLPLEGLYPGDNYVDWVGVDAYNWGTNPAKPDQWLTFSQVFTPIYNHLGTIAPSKPMMIAETGSTEYGGNKATWITDALTTQLPHNFPRIKALVWFNWNADGMDWVIETSSSAQAAFAAGISSSYYATNSFANLNVSPVPPLP